MKPGTCPHGCGCVQLKYPARPIVIRRIRWCCMSDRLNQTDACRKLVAYLKGRP